jgi:hypothetical protein
MSGTGERWVCVFELSSGDDQVRCGHHLSTIWIFGQIAGTVPILEQKRRARLVSKSWTAGVRAAMMAGFDGFARGR